jgi:hypothetical protein
MPKFIDSELSRRNLLVGTAAAVAFGAAPISLGLLPLPSAQS